MKEGWSPRLSLASREWRSPLFASVNAQEVGSGFGQQHFGQIGTHG